MQNDHSGRGLRALLALATVQAVQVVLACGDGGETGRVDAPLSPDASAPPGAGAGGGASDVAGSVAGAGGASEPAPSGLHARWLPDNPGFAGLLTLDEYDWGALGGRLGVVQLELATGNKRRFLSGELPSRHPNGTTSYLQLCGTGVNRLALADASGLARVVSPCSSELPQPGDSRTRYGVSRLSPDAGRVAVEVVYEIYFEGTFAYTVVYDVEGAQLAQFDGLFAPAWTPDGRLLMAGNGIYLTGAALSTPERIDDGALTAPVNNPAAHPDGARLVFEYNQGIWEMGLDGSGLRERVYGPMRLRYPTYSPDGSAIVYLGVPESNYYDRALYFTDLEVGGSYSFNLVGIIGSGPGSSSIVPNGPLSWTLE